MNFFAITRPRRLIVSMILVMMLLSCRDAFASIYINLVAANASPDKVRELPFKYFLPRELKPDDILDTAGLQIDYDIDQKSYFVYGTLTMQPQESRVLKIEVRDVWKVTDEEISRLKKEVDDHLVRTQNTPYHDRASVLKQDINRKLDYIVEQQENYSGNVERRIEEYRAYTEVIAQVRKDIFSIENWESVQAKMPITQSPLENKTVKFVLEVENPRKDIEKTLKQQHYLPMEVLSEHIIDSRGFDIRFDEKKQQTYLFKEELFQPGEKKRYEIIIQDIWYIPEDKTKGFTERADTAMNELQGTDYENSAKYLFDQINQGIKGVIELQERSVSMKEHVGAFRINKDTMKTTEDQLLQLERILALVRQKRLEELEKSRVKNILKKIQSLDGINAIAQQLFKQKLSINKTWKIIIAILSFVAVFTAFHFLVWKKRSRDARRRQAQQKAQPA